MLSEAFAVLDGAGVSLPPAALPEVTAPEEPGPEAPVPVLLKPPLPHAAVARMLPIAMTPTASRRVV
jgi:hypothetical protein